ncbi:hypothetical protein J6590_009739 [Homalodisca vitripennis]|nr:hypothetical protein J6590_009739 [Homalodisca vitripennis]
MHHNVEQRVGGQISAMCCVRVWSTDPLLEHSIRALIAHTRTVRRPHKVREPPSCPHRARSLIDQKIYRSRRVVYPRCGPGTSRLTWVHNGVLTRTNLPL